MSAHHKQSVSSEWPNPFLQLASQDAAQRMGTPTQLRAQREALFLTLPGAAAGFYCLFFSKCSSFAVGDVKPRVPLSVTSRQHGSGSLHLGSRKAGFIFLSGSFKAAQFPLLKKRETKEKN